MYDQALEKSILIFRHMAKTGCKKQRAIDDLFKMGMIEKSEYRWECPLCDHYRLKINNYACGSCPWHVIGGKQPGGRVACVRSGSPYKPMNGMTVMEKMLSSEIKHHAQNVADFLVTLRDIDDKQEEPKKPDRPDIPVDTPMWVWDNFGNPERGHFARWPKHTDDGVFCFDGGRTKFTSYNTEWYWGNYSLTDPLKGEK